MARIGPSTRSSNGPRKGLTKKPDYEFDAALSFAGEDRRHASKLATVLTSKGYRVFYDKHFRGQLWGKDQHEYEQIYGPKSRFVIPFVSEHYTRKEWTRFEFESAKREAKNRDGDFLLPVRLDNARLFGLNDDVNYLSLGDLTIGEVASEFTLKCGPPLGRSGDTDSTMTTSARLAKERIAALLSSETRSVLGLLVTSILPLPLANYKQIFPSLNWSAHCHRLSQVGLIRTGRNRVSVSSAAIACFGDRDEIAVLHKRWVDALGSVRWHVDTALFLAMHYLEVGSFDDVVNTIADVVETTSLGDWNQIYLGALRPLTVNAGKLKLCSTTRKRSYNSLGICLSNAGEHEEALTWFRKVGTNHTAESDRWLGQSLLNRGVSYVHLNRPDTAASYYRKAIMHGEKAGDDILVARAKGNLAQLITDTSPKDAARLLSDSLSLKRKHKDEAGMAIAYGQLAKLKAAIGQTQQALNCLLAAKKIAQRLGMRETLALTLHDLATAFSSSGKSAAALQYYRRGRRLASDDGYLQTQIFIGSSEGRLCFELGRYDEALAIFRDVIHAAQEAKDRLGLTCGHHAIGMILRLRGQSKLGHRHLDEALRLGRDAQDDDWIARCLIDMCRHVTQGKFIGFDLKSLRRAAVGEQRRRNWAPAGRIWTLVADESRETVSGRTVRLAFVSAAKCYAKVPTLRTQQSDVLSRFYLWLWQNGECAKAIEVLGELEDVGRSANRPDLVSRAIDQRGVCLQDMDECHRARREHLRALLIARRHDDLEQTGRSLNNLGEALRKLGKYEDAIRAFREAERITLACRDFEGALSAAQNRVLVLWAQNNEQQVARVLTWCRHLAIRHQLWDQAITALARLAELAWGQKRTKEAKQYYRRALMEAKKHNGVPGHRIALNYCRLLLSEGDAALAARVLPQWKDAFMTEPDAYLFHYTLAETYHEMKDFESAEIHWRLGCSSAEAAGDRDYVAMCASRLAEVLETRHQFRASERELRVALRNESEPMGKALLLIQMLRMQLANGHDKGAEKTFGEARDIADKNRLHTVTVDIHVMVGDYYWLRSRRNRLNALKAYIVGILGAVQIDLDAYGELVVHIITFLTAAKAAPLPREFTLLSRSLEKWVAKNIPSDPSGRSLVMWPIALLGRVLPFAGDPQKLADELGRLAKSGEFFPSTSNG